MGTNNAQINFRPARKEDCGLIAEKIKELAKFEKHDESSIKVTKEMLEKDGGFNNAEDRKFFHCLIAEANVDGKIEMAGYAIYFYTYSTWLGRDAYLEDIFVSDKFRRRGLGRKLIAKIAKEALDNGCKKLKLNVLSWNKMAIGLYEKLGGQNLTESEDWHIYYFDNDSLNKLANLNVNVNDVNSFESFD